MARLGTTTAILTAVLLAAVLPCCNWVAAQRAATYPQANGRSRYSPPDVSPPAYPQTGGRQPYVPRVAVQTEPIGAELLPIEAGQIIARVSDQVVLAGEVLPQVNAMLRENAASIPPGELPAIRRQLMQRQLEPLIETKLLYAEFRRTVPSENLPAIKKNLDEEFDRSQLPKLYKATKTTNRSELETKLREQGSSLEHQQLMFHERTIATQWLQQQINRDEEITHDQMLDYYNQHLSDYQYDSQARWEEISVRFDRFATASEAYRRLAELGNQVMRGAAFADVAKAHSHGVTADEGGQFDWTTQGSLVSTVIDEAIFHLPVGRLSQIIEDRQRFYIVRVLERKVAGTKPFVEAQEKIGERLRQEGIRIQVREYLASLRRKHRIRTIFQDGDEQIVERGDNGRRR